MVLEVVGRVGEGIGAAGQLEILGIKGHACNGHGPSSDKWLSDSPPWSYGLYRAKEAMLLERSRCSLGSIALFGAELDGG